MSLSLTIDPDDRALAHFAEALEAADGAAGDRGQNGVRVRARRPQLPRFR